MQVDEERHDDRTVTLSRYTYIVGTLFPIRHSTWESPSMGTMTTKAAGRMVGRFIMCPVRNRSLAPSAAFTADDYGQCIH